jgi:hypothetical protein
MEPEGSVDRAATGRPGPGRPDTARRLGAAAVALAVVLAVFAAYAPVLGRFFHEIDDATLLLAARDGLPATVRFRPLWEAWNALLFAAFGTRPAGYHLAGIGLHAGSALAVLALVRALGRGWIAAGVAGLAFAVFQSPSQAVLWIAASNGLLSVLFVLLSALAWLAYLKGRGAAFLGLALVCAAGAMGSKEDCVVLGPLLVGIDAAWSGPRALRSRRALLRYLPFALLGAAYLAVAYRPWVWSRSPEVGEYALTPALVPRLFANLLALFWPRVVREDELGAAWALGGLVLAALLAWIGVREAARRRAGPPLVALGLVVALAGLLPALPGPYVQAGTRLAYPSAIGVALLAGGLVELLWNARVVLAWPALRGLVAAGFAGWTAVQVLAVRSVESWRYAPRCRRLERLVETTDAVVLGPLREHGGEAVVLGPAIWNAKDYVSALVVFLDVRPDEVELRWVPYDGRFPARLEQGGELDPGRGALYACERDGTMRRLGARETAPLELWEEQALHDEQRGRGHALAVVALRGERR